MNCGTCSGPMPSDGNGVTSSVCSTPVQLLMEDYGAEESDIYSMQRWENWR